MKKIIAGIDSIIAKIAIGIIYIYQYTLSPDKGLPSLWLKGRICPHEPHCSEYGSRVFNRYGFIKGIIPVIDRVLHCTPSMEKIYDPDHYRVVFFSSAPIGVPFLQHLAEDKKFEVVGVVTMPDAPSGRGMQTQENIIKQEGKKINNNKIKILLLHGWGGHGKENWFGWLKDKLEKEGHTVYNPDLINSERPSLQEQLADIQPYVDALDEDSIIIGHSLGCILANHFLLKNKKKIKAVINVAPASEVNDSEKTRTAIKMVPELERYIKEPLNHKEIKKYTDAYMLYLSDNDPYIDLEKSKKYFGEKLSEATIREFNGMGHFNEAAGIKEFPEIYEEIQQIVDLDFIATPAKLNPEKSEEGKKFATWLKKKNPDFLVVIAYGKIIPQPILDIPRIAPINVHGSLLPKYRGASPIQSVFLEGEKETGITIMKMDATMDTGDMLDTIKFKLPFARTVKEVIEEMKEKGPKLLNSTLWGYGKGLIKEVKQNNEKATYCSKMEKEDGEIVPTKDSLEVVYKKYRAFYLWPKLHFFQKAKNENMLRIIIEKLVLNEKSYEEKKVLPLFDSNWKINECVEEIVLKPEGKKILSREEFLNGYIKK